MSDSGLSLAARLIEMRKRFDEAFAAPPPGETEPRQALIVLSTAGEELAVRLEEISGLAAIRTKVLPVPSDIPELIGITAVRGDVVPVFSLARLLGLAGADQNVRWIVTAGNGAATVGFGFESFDGYMQAARADVLPAAGPSQGRHLRQTARCGGYLRRLVDVTSLAASVRNSQDAAPPQ